MLDWTWPLVRSGDVTRIDASMQMNELTVEPIRRHPLNRGNAITRISSFVSQYGETHFILACHAAFPLLLTPDLLYHIWSNFVPQAPWTAIADILLSRLCYEVGYELYQMDTEVRNLLLKELKDHKYFGQQHLNRLADFLTNYVTQELKSDDQDLRNLAQAQRWTALTYTRPGEVASELAAAIEDLAEENVEDLVRLASLVETFAEPLAEFAPLLVYARGKLELAYNIVNVPYQEKFPDVSSPVETVVSSVELTKNQATTDILEPLSLRTLKVGQQFKGIVKNITNFGAFINFGIPQDGLLHISELSKQKVEKVTDVINLGQEVTVWIKKVDSKRGRISLTMVRPIQLKFKDIEEDSELEGVVTRLEAFGAFVDIGADRDGLVHISQISYDYVKHPSDVLAIGDKVTVKVLKINRKKRQVDLSIKALLPLPPTTAEKIDEAKKAYSVSDKRSSATEIISVIRKAI